MAAPRKLSIISNCGIELEILNDWKGINYCDSPRCWKYRIKNHDEICAIMGGEMNRETPYEGFLSPASPITLQPMVKKQAGIPSNAKSYAFMYPSTELAKAIFQRPSSDSETNSCSFFDSLPTSTKYTFDDTGLKSAAILGGFAYFDSQFNCITVNALSRVYREEQLKFSGPFNVHQSACVELYKLRRVQQIRLDVFHEAGFSSFAWVRPKEKFQFHSVLEGYTQSHGALLFFRENGTAVGYAVDASGFVDPNGRVGVISESIGHIGEAKFSYNNIELYSEIKRWGRKMMHSFGKPTETAKLTEAIQDQRTVLHKACHATLGIEFIKELLLTYKGNLSCQDDFGWTPLHYACRFSPKDSALIKLLVDMCPQAALQADPYFRFPLHIACDSDSNSEVIEALLERDKSTPKVTISKRTRRFGLLPLHLACYSGSPNVIKILLNADPAGYTVIEKTSCGETPLHLAILMDLPVDIVKRFLDADSKLNNGLSDNSIFDEDTDIYQPFDGKLPLHLACWHNSPSEVIELLLEKDEENKTIDATVDTVLEGANLNEKANYRHFSLEDPSFRRSSHLLNAHPSLHSLESSQHSVKKGGVAALHLAMKHGSKKIISLLLQKETEKDRMNPDEISTLHRKDRRGRIPLHVACEYNVDSEIIQLLLNLDPLKETTQFEDLQGFRPLHYACENGETSAETVHILCDAEERFIEYKIKNEGGPRNRSTHHGDFERKRTPLYLAVKAGASPKIIERLLKPENFLLIGFDDAAMTELAERVTNDTSIQNNVIGRFSERLYFTVLILDLYAHITALLSFIIGSLNLVKSRADRRPPALLILSTIFFILRELLQIMSVGSDYIGDIWSWVEDITVILLLLSANHMFEQVAQVEQDANNEAGENKEPDVHNLLLAFTGFLLIVTSIFFLRSTFLPFARFVGGLLMILKNLIPFIIVSLLLIFAHSYIYWISNHDECEGSMSSCFRLMIYGLFNFEPVERDIVLLDALFGFVIVIVLLNVVIAIVGEAWELAAGQSTQMFWKFRLEKIAEVRYASRLRDHLNKNASYSTSLWNSIDNVGDIAYENDVTWTRTPYNLVVTKDHYYNPQEYFYPDVAEKIRMAHSLQGNLYWAKMDAQNAEHELSAVEKLIIILKWLGSCLFYALLVALGFPTCGWLWPKNFRKAILSFGIEVETVQDIKKRIKKEMKKLESTEGKIKSE